MHEEFYVYQARSQALLQARRDADTGLISADKIIEVAHKYEAYLLGKSTPPDERQCLGPPSTIFEHLEKDRQDKILAFPRSEQ